MEIYTDGTLETNHNLQTSMGTGCVFFNAITQESLTLYSNTNKWPSSTAAELQAILIALMTTAHYTGNICIHTDSQVAIQSINNVKRFDHKLVHKPNLYTILQIRDRIHKHTGTVTFQKVAAHTGNQYNDIVDKLAKKGLWSNS